MSEPNTYRQVIDDLCQMDADLKFLFDRYENDIQRLIDEAQDDDEKKPLFAPPQE